MQKTNELCAKKSTKNSRKIAFAIFSIIIYNGRMDERETKLSISTGTFIRFWLVILGFLAVIGLIWKASGVLVLIATAFFLALILNRPVSFLARHVPGHSRALATFISYMLILALLALLFFNVIPIFIKQISVFIGNAPELIREIQSRNSGLEHFLAQRHVAAQYDAWIADLGKQLGSFANRLGGSAVGVLTTFANAIVNISIVAVLTFLMLVEGPDWEKKYWAIVYRDRKKRARHQVIARKMYNVVGDYITGQMIVAAISATLTALAVWTLAIVFREIDPSLVLPAWITIFVMTFVPMFGATIGGVVVSALLALFAWPAAIFYLVFFIIEQQLENNFISPKIQSKRLNMSALIVLASIMIGLSLAGILGALVAIPIAGCALVLVREFLAERRKNHEILSGDEDVAIVFVEEDRKFVKPKLPRRARKNKPEK